MKQRRPFTITGGRLVLPGGVRPGAIRCVDGRIAALGDVNPAEGDEVIDAAGALVAPGLIDFGVFAIDKPAFHFGGITRAALMPDSSPPLDRPSSVRFAAQSGKPDLWVHPLAAATVGLEGFEALHAQRRAARAAVELGLDRADAELRQRHPLAPAEHGRLHTEDFDATGLFAGHGARTRLQLERAMGIEPTSVAWEATALPLSYARAA